MLLPSRRFDSSVANPRPRRLWPGFGGVAAGIGAGLLAYLVAVRGANLAQTRGELPPAPTLAPTDRLLILAPHPDDETLGAGGIIATARALGLPVSIVFLTCGDGSRSTLLARNARRSLQRCPPEDFVAFAALRQREARQACIELGVLPADVHFLGYPDGGCRALWNQYWSDARLYRSSYTSACRSPYVNVRTPAAPFCGAAVLRDITGIIGDFRPTLLLTTHPADAHPDHAAAYAFAACALESLRLRPDFDPSQEVRLLTFMIHLGIWPVPNGLHPEAALAPPAAVAHTGTRWMTAPLAPAARAAKSAAVERYQSQLAVTPHYLRAFIRRNELCGEDLPTDCTHAPERDSPLRCLWPACDLQSAALAPQPDGSLHVKIRARSAASPLLRYGLALHAVVPSTGKASPVRPAHLEFFHDGHHWQASWQTPDATWTLPACSRDGHLKAELSRALTAELTGTSAASLCFEATAKLGSRTLDRTPLGILRFP